MQSTNFFNLLTKDIFINNVFDRLEWIDKIPVTSVNRSIHNRLKDEITWKKIKAAEILFFNQIVAPMGIHDKAVVGLYRYAADHVNKNSFRACLALEKRLEIYWDLRKRQQTINKIRFQYLIEDTDKTISQIKSYASKPYALRVLRAALVALQEYWKFPGITDNDRTACHAIINNIIVKLTRIADSTTKTNNIIKSFLLVEEAVALLN